MSTIEKIAMNISLTHQLETYVKEKVSTGMYNSASEVMREALRLMQSQDALQTIKLESLRKDIAQGIQSLDAGAGKIMDMNAIKTKAQNAKQSQ
jgi:antitoxin ParD1/3/4